MNRVRNSKNSKPRKLKPNSSSCGSSTSTSVFATGNSITIKRERTARAHRLITRSAAVESVSPLVKVLGEVEFFSLVERIFSMPEVKGMVMEAVNAHNVAEQLRGD